MFSMFKYSDKEILPKLSEMCENFCQDAGEGNYKAILVEVMVNEVIEYENRKK